MATAAPPHTETFLSAVAQAWFWLWLWLLRGAVPTALASTGLRSTLGLLLPPSTSVSRELCSPELEQLCPRACWLKAGSKSGC